MSREQNKYPQEVYEIVKQQGCPQCGGTQRQLSVARSYDSSIRMRCKNCGGQWTRTWRNIAESLEKLANSNTSSQQIIKDNYRKNALIIRKYTNTEKLRKGYKGVWKLKKLLNQNLK